MICFFVANHAKSQLAKEFLFLSNTEKQQKGFAIGKINITTPLEKSLKNYFQITDTLDLHNEWVSVKVKGFDFQFTLTIHRDSTIVKSGNRKRMIQEGRIPPYPVWYYDITSIDTLELDRISRKLREMPYDTIVLRQAFQACISYALEGIFNSYGIDSEPFFFRRSNLAEKKDLEVILDKMFVKVETLPDIRRKTLKSSEYLYKNQVLILFRDYRGENIHACFNLQDRTWTKNGMSAFTSYPAPIPVIDIYNSKRDIKSDTPGHRREFFTLGSVDSIEIYQLKSEIFE